MVNGTNRKVFFKFAVPLTSIYCVSINDKEAMEDRRKMRKNSPYKEQWKNEFLFLARDFCIPDVKIKSIINSVVTAAKPTDTTDKLKIRAMNKLYDLI